MNTFSVERVRDGPKIKTTDPIFGLIAAHKKAVSAYRRKATSFHRLKERLDIKKDQERLHQNDG